VKRLLCGLICMAFLVRASSPQAAAPKAGSSHPAVRVFYRGKGADRDVRRFQKFLEIALEDYDITLSDSARDADATANVELSRGEKTEYLYTPLVWMEFTSQAGGNYMAKSCSSVSTSDSVFKEPINVISRITFPQDWKKHERLAVYIDESAVKALTPLLPALTEGLSSGGHHITNVRAGADVVLQHIRVQNLAVPMRTKVLSITFEVLDRGGARFFYTSGKGATELTYLGADPGIKLENIPCSPTFTTFWNDNDGTWREARSIAKAIREHFDKATHSN